MDFDSGVSWDGRRGSCREDKFIYQILRGPATIYGLLFSLNHYILGTHNELPVFDSSVSLESFFMGVHAAPSQRLIFIENKTRGTTPFFVNA